MSVDFLVCVLCKEVFCDVEFYIDIEDCGSVCNECCEKHKLSEKDLDSFGNLKKHLYSEEEVVAKKIKILKK